MSETNINEKIISVDLEANIESSNVLNQKKLDESLSQLEQINSILIKVINGCLKIFGVIIIFILLAPLCIADLYYAYTDNSCVHDTSGKLSVNLFTYLVVDGIFGGAGIVIYSITICCLGIDGFMDLIITFCGRSLLTLTRIFNLAWTVVGSIIFWKLIDSDNCNKGIYNYVFALLIIRFITLTITQLCSESN